MWHTHRPMRWLRLVGSLKSYVSFADYCLFHRALLQKRPTISRSLLIVATPYIHFYDVCIIGKVSISHICISYRHISDVYIFTELLDPHLWIVIYSPQPRNERWGAGVETQKKCTGIGGWGRVPFNEPYAPSLSTIYDGAWGSLNSWKWYSTPAPHLSS